MIICLITGYTFIQGYLLAHLVGQPVHHYGGYGYSHQHHRRHYGEPYRSHYGQIWSFLESSKEDLQKLNLDLLYLVYSKTFKCSIQLLINLTRTIARKKGISMPVNINYKKTLFLDSSFFPIHLVTAMQQESSRTFWDLSKAYCKQKGT